MKPITRIVYTGGPCAGKTTALSRSSDYFSGQGYRVVIVPEAATLIIRAGFNPVDFTNGNLGLFQENILSLCCTLEEAATKLAANYRDQPLLMLCDRGAMDGKAYTSKNQWKEILDKRRVTESQLREQRYDAVIHLVSAAVGAVEHYSNATNPARHEEVDVAREVDGKLRQAWKGHPRLRIIDNSTDFESKVERTLKEVSRVLK